MKTKRKKKNEILEKSKNLEKERAMEAKERNKKKKGKNEWMNS